MGKPKYIETPEILWDHFTRYKEWVQENPILKEDYVGKDADKVHRQLTRPLSWVGFESHLFLNDIIGDLDDYEKNTNNSYEDYQPIIRAIKKIIETDQFEGATVGIYQQNIIARKLGLVDKKEIEQKTITVIPPAE